MIAADLAIAVAKSCLLVAVEIQQFDFTNNLKQILCNLASLTYVAVIDPGFKFLDLAFEEKIAAYSCIF